jgi:hypothetical protein
MAQMNPSIRVEEQPCPVCGKLLNMAVSVALEIRAPKTGDISICVYCETINVFQADGSLREADVEECQSALRFLQLLKKRRESALLN